MSDILVTSKECLVICVDEPATSSPVFRNPAWRGVLECKSQDWSIDQVAAHMGNPEYVVRILKIGPYGDIVNITDKVLDWVEGNV